jgi:hypothetical protein
MKYFVRHLSVVLVVLSLAVSAAFAKDKTRKATVNFSDDVTVGDTLVKKGDYQIKFDEETSVLSVLKNGKVVATTNGTLQERTDKSGSTALQFTANHLVSIAFGNNKQEVVVGPGGSSTGSQE